MLKPVLISILAIYSTQAFSDNNFEYKSETPKVSQSDNVTIVNQNTSEDSSSQLGKFEPNGSATIDSIKMDLTPKWAATSDNVDRERAGFKNIQIACLSKSCEKKHSDIDDEFSKFGEKFKK